MFYTLNTQTENFHDWLETTFTALKFASLIDEYKDGFVFPQVYNKLYTELFELKTIFHGGCI